MAPDAAVGPRIGAMRVERTVAVRSAVLALRCEGLAVFVALPVVVRLFALGHVMAPDVAVGPRIGAMRVERTVAVRSAVLALRCEGLAAFVALTVAVRLFALGLLMAPNVAVGLWIGAMRVADLAEALRLRRLKTAQ